MRQKADTSAAAQGVCVIIFFLISCVLEVEALFRFPVFLCHGFHGCDSPMLPVVLNVHASKRFQISLDYELYSEVPSKRQVVQLCCLNVELAILLLWTDL